MDSQPLLSCRRLMRSSVGIYMYIACVGLAVLITSAWGQSTTPALDGENGLGGTLSPSEMPVGSTNIPNKFTESRIMTWPSQGLFLSVVDGSSEDMENYRTNIPPVLPSQGVFGHEGSAVMEMTTSVDKMLKKSVTKTLDASSIMERKSDLGYLESSIVDSEFSSIHTALNIEQYQSAWSGTVGQHSSTVHRMFSSTSDGWSSSYQRDSVWYAEAQSSDFVGDISANVMSRTSLPDSTSSVVGFMPTGTTLFDQTSTMSTHSDISVHSNVFNQSSSDSKIYASYVVLSSHWDTSFHLNSLDRASFSDIYPKSILSSMPNISSFAQMTMVLSSYPSSETMWSGFHATVSPLMHSSSEIALSLSALTIIDQSLSWIPGVDNQSLSFDSEMLESSSLPAFSSHNVSSTYPELDMTHNISELLSPTSVLMPSLPTIMPTQFNLNITSESFYQTKYLSSHAYVEVSKSEINFTQEPVYATMMSSQELFPYDSHSSSPVYNHSTGMPSIPYSSVPYNESLIHSTQSGLYLVPSQTANLPNSSSSEYQTLLSSDIYAQSMEFMSSHSDQFESTHFVLTYMASSVKTPEEMSSPDVLYMAPSESLAETFYPVLPTVPLYDYSSDILESGEFRKETIAPVSSTKEYPHVFSTPSQEVTASSSVEIPTSSAAPRTTTTPPIVQYMNQKFLLTFNGDCQPLIGHLDRIQEFQAKVKDVIIVNLFLDESMVYMDRLTCGSVKSSVILYNTTQNYSGEIFDLVSSGNFVVEMEFADTNGTATKTYRAYKVEGVSLEDSTDNGSGERKGNEGLDDKDVILIALACCICAILVIIGVVICAKQMYRKKYAQSFNLMDTPHVNLKMEDFTLTRIPRPRSSYCEEDGVQVQSYYQSNGHALVRPVPPPRQNFKRHSQQNSQSSDFDSTFDRSVDISDVRIDDKTSSFVQNSRPFTYAPNGHDLAPKDNGGNYMVRSHSIDSESTVHDRSTENLVPGLNGPGMHGSVNPIYSGDDTEATASIASDPPPYTDNQNMDM